MILDFYFQFDKTPQSVSTTSDVLSSNVYDAGSSKKVFEGYGPKPCKLHVGVRMSGGSGSLSWRARLVGADNAALTTNPVILADTGVQLNGDSGSAYAVNDMTQRVIDLLGQTVSKRYYGMIYTLGGTSPTADITAVISETVQTWMMAHKQAVPT
jgi:hypothetical protein